MPSENQQREKIGLRLISPTWNLYRVAFSEEDWKASQAGDIVKKVHRDSIGKVVWEEDYYYTGRSFFTEKGQSWEFLAVYYDYTNAFLDVKYVGQDRSITEALDTLRTKLAPMQEKLSVADQILEKWGIRRL